MLVSTAKIVHFLGNFKKRTAASWLLRLLAGFVQFNMSSDNRLGARD